MSPGDSQGSPKPRRRCCGMRPWVFGLVCIIVMLLVAAAVVIPIVLIVLPRQREAAAAAASASSSSTSKSSCEMSTPCLNGGVSISRNGSCGCVCVDGFGGKTCATPGDGSCTTLNLDGTDTKFANATVGNAIPRLLEDSQANFSIPLDSTVILDLFSSKGISCTSENALVSFNGASRKRGPPIFLDPIQPANEPEASMETLAPIPINSHSARRHHHQIVRRQQENKVATTNGIIFEPTGTAGAASAPTKTSNKSTPSQSDSSVSKKSDSDPIITPRIQDFARVSILFILQKTRKMKAATAAQEQIQSFFTRIDQDSNGEAKLDETMGLGGTDMPSRFVLDFVNFKIQLEDGSVVGG